MGRGIPVQRHRHCPSPGPRTVEPGGIDAGRVIAIVVMLVGIGFAAILTAAAAERLMRAERAELQELEVVEQGLAEIARRLDAIEQRL